MPNLKDYRLVHTIAHYGDRKQAVERAAKEKGTGYVIAIERYANGYAVRKYEQKG